MKKRSGFKVMARLIGLVKPLSGYMTLAVFMGLAGHLAATFITIFGGYAVTDAAGIKAPFSMTFIIVSVIVFALLRGVLRYAEQSCNHFIAFKLLALIREKVFIALRRLCPAKLEGKDKGDLISVITSDIELLEVFYAHTVSPVLIAVLFSVLLCLFIGRFHPLLGLIALAAYVTVGAVIPVATSKISGGDGLRFRTESGELSGFVLDSLRGLPEILQYDCGEKRLEEMNVKIDGLSAAQKRMKNRASQNQGVTGTVILIFDLIMLLASAALYKNGSIDFAGTVIPTIALMSSFGQTVALSNLGSTLQNTFAAGNRVLDILEESPAVEEISDGQDIEFSGAGAQNVTFSYGGDVILKDLSVDIPKASVTGITGASGSGKSTLLKLFMRFWDTKEGQIRISDTDISKINTESLRNAESFVTQETHLFHDSIKNNIRIAKTNATDKEIEEACKKASVHDFIMTLKDGYDTPVGELGDTLSGGERQRIGIARAFLHDAPFMLLDEPTSNLDSLNEAIILKSLDTEKNDKTVLLVSHRKSTMRIADRIYSVEHGRMS